MIVSKSNIEKRLNPHLLKFVSLPAEMDVKLVPARSLLCKKNRFDLMFKYIYARAKICGNQSHFFKKCYLESIRVITNGTFVEGDGFKTSSDDFLNRFDRLIDSMQKEGFLADASVIPVNDQGECVDGAHRVAAAAALGLDVPVVVVNRYLDLSYNRFKRSEMSRTMLDYGLLTWIETHEKLHVVNLHKCAEGREEDVEAILKRHGTIFGKKSIEIKFSGYHWLEWVFYRKHSWMGEFDNKLLGSLHHAVKSGVGNSSLRVYVVEFENLNDAIEAKKEIRNLYQLGNYSIHITDTQDEARELGQIYFNENSLHFLNNTKIISSGFGKDVLRDFFNFKKFFAMHFQERDHVVMDGSIALAIYGLRKNRDVDFLAAESCSFHQLVHERYGEHSSQLVYHRAAREELLYDPENYFYFEGMKVLSLQCLMSFKKKRGDVKDSLDVKLIQQIVEPSLLRKIEIYFEQSKNVIRYLRRKCSIMIKDFIFPIDSKQRRVAVKMRNALRGLFFDVKEHYGSVIQKKSSLRVINYNGYSLYYSCGTSIVCRFVRTGAYEPETVEALVSAVARDSRTPLFLDIGANIGMISVALLQRVPKLRIFAFEPGVHQHGLFERTIKENNLDSQIKLSALALSSETGTAEFSVHSTEHASGDGFKDTGRAGTSETVIVNTERLDNWWHDNGCPDVTLMKIDVEGAECLVFDGAEEMLRHCKPSILFELHSKNLAAYNYSVDAVLDRVKSYGYVVANLDGTLLTSEQYDLLTSKDYGCDLIAFFQE